MYKLGISVLWSLNTLFRCYFFLFSFRIWNVVSPKPRCPKFLRCLLNEEWFILTQGTIFHIHTFKYRMLENNTFQFSHNILMGNGNTNFLDTCNFLEFYPHIDSMHPFFLLTTGSQYFKYMLEGFSPSVLPHSLLILLYPLEFYFFPPSERRTPSARRKYLYPTWQKWNPYFITAVNPNRSDWN